MNRTKTSLTAPSPAVPRPIASDMAPSPARRIGQLQNSRHELFAQGLFQGKSGIQAYEDAGFIRNVNNASRLKGTDKVKARTVFIG
jgi:hypothetical protein